MKRDWRIAAAALLLVFTADHGLTARRAQAADKQAASQVAPVPKGLRVFSCGHSFSQFVIPILQEIANAAGIADHQVAGKSSIG
ncbi:MAG TPA: hypothetical protein VHY20_04655, partial [Pirellulales bacterium]|nr:hypothetical protein [Pirellulales bacterium]